MAKPKEPEKIETFLNVDALELELGYGLIKMVDRKQGGDLLDRIGNTALSLPQLKILQEVVTLTVFVPFAILYMGQPVKLDYLWAGLCMCGAVYFMFRS